MPIFSQTSEYAIRALIELARLDEGQTMLARDLAKKTNVPSHYLSKILQGLARVGLLESRKGIHGGFRLAMPGDDVTLFMIVSHLENLARLNECMLGQEECSDARACPLHDFWSALRTNYLNKLGSTSLQDLVDFTPPGEVGAESSTTETAAG